MSRRMLIAVSSGLIAAGALVGVAGPSTASTPPATPGSSGPVWSGVSTGEAYSCGTQVDHTLWCWGSNGSAQLGLGGIHGHLNPTQVGTDSNWQAVSAGIEHTCATRLDHTLWCWGWNGYGQLGLGSRDSGRYVPTQVGTSSDWAAVTLSYDHTCATRLDHTLWCWGWNREGQLGLGDTMLRKTPTRVGTGAGWEHVSTGLSYKPSTCATRTDGTLWCWGYNASG